MAKIGLQSEIGVLYARYKNMDIAAKEYEKQQANILGIKLPEKSKERER